MIRIAPKPVTAETGAPVRADVVSLSLTKTVSTLLDRSITLARDAMTAAQSAAGYWLFELEADCTIPAEYIMMMHFLDEIDAELETKIAAYLRTHQQSGGGWPLYHGGEFNMSCTVKAYYALKLAGDDVKAPHMVRARAAILERGGAARSNVFTRIALALFGQIPWRGVPYIPVEIMLLPKWFFFHLDKVSYWSRTVMVPLFILCTRKPLAKNPRGVHIQELFTTPPEIEHDYFRDARKGGWLGKVLLVVDRLSRRIDPFIPKAMRDRATRAAEQWMLERLNGEDGLGAIFPAMVNALEVMTILGYPADDPRRVTAKRALQKLLVVGPSTAYCQPCVSPVWDTALTALAMQETGCAPSSKAVTRALDWLQAEQILDEPGDWQVDRPKLKGGGWAFQFANDYYPDLDDTAVVAWAMHQAPNAADYAENISRALDWLKGMQSENGGFAAFDADNTSYYLNKIPFADHGALLDPPTSDVTARVVTVLSLIDRPEDKAAVERALAYLRAEQEDDGSWFGRWGTNYIYGTWSVLIALSQAATAPDDPAVRRAVSWLNRRQNPDGGWGESNDGYKNREDAKAPSTPYHTAWALLGLLAAGESESETVRRGVNHLMRTQQTDGLWSDPTFTAPGFPRVFYLKYHGYCRYFPLWALSAYRTLTRARNHALNVAGVVAALDREARALGPALQAKAGFEILAGGTLRAVSGMGCAAAGMAARRLVEAGATALVSWGLAGGLDSDLEAGAICLPREVVAPDGMRFATASSWRETLTASVASFRPVTSGALLTSLHPIADVAAKAAARHQTGAVAVDMESSAVAEVAAASHVPFMAVRVIVDTALDAIPGSVTAAGESGQVRIARLLLGLARSPGEIVPLIRLARRYGAAMRSLRAVAQLGRLGPRDWP